MPVFERIKALCDEKGLSILELEKRAGLGNATVRGWKESSPRLDKLAAVAGVLGVSLDYLAGTEAKRDED